MSKWCTYINKGNWKDGYFSWQSSLDNSAQVFATVVVLSNDTKSSICLKLQVHKGPAFDWHGCRFASLLWLPQKDTWCYMITSWDSACSLTNDLQWHNFFLEHIISLWGTLSRGVQRVPIWALNVLLLAPNLHCMLEQITKWTRTDLLTLVFMDNLLSPWYLQ